MEHEDDFNTNCNCYACNGPLRFVKGAGYHPNRYHPNYSITKNN